MCILNFEVVCFASGKLWVLCYVVYKRQHHRLDVVMVWYLGFSQLYILRWQSFRMSWNVVWWIGIIVSEQAAALVFRVPWWWGLSTILCGMSSQKTIIVIALKYVIVVMYRNSSQSCLVVENWLERFRVKYLEDMKNCILLAGWSTC